MFWVIGGLRRTRELATVPPAEGSGQGAMSLTVGSSFSVIVAGTFFGSAEVGGHMSTMQIHSHSQLRGGLFVLLGLILAFWLAAMSSVPGSRRVMDEARPIETRAGFVQRLPGATSLVAMDGISGAIETLLGQLQTADEAVLREQLLGLRRAGIEYRSRADVQSAWLVASWAETFAERLEEAAIPAGTRASLTMKLAAYEHEILTTGVSSSASESTREPARAVDAGSASPTAGG
jgi:hypothetical protein